MSPRADFKGLVLRPVSLLSDLQASLRLTEDPFLYPRSSPPLVRGLSEAFQSSGWAFRVSQERARWHIVGPELVTRSLAAKRSWSAGVQGSGALFASCPSIPSQLGRGPSGPGLDASKPLNQLPVYRQSEIGGFFKTTRLKFLEFPGPRRLLVPSESPLGTVQALWNL